MHKCLGKDLVEYRELFAGTEFVPELRGEREEVMFSFAGLADFVESVEGVFDEVDAD